METKNSDDDLPSEETVSNPVSIESPSCEVSNSILGSSSPTKATTIVEENGAAPPAPGPPQPTHSKPSGQGSEFGDEVRAAAAANETANEAASRQPQPQPSSAGGALVEQPPGEGDQLFAEHDFFASGPEQDVQCVARLCTGFTRDERLRRQERILPCFSNAPLCPECEFGDRRKASRSVIR